jgi:hypothetical protein
MTKLTVFLSACAMLALAFVTTTPAQAQWTLNSPSKPSVEHAKQVSRACPGKWEAQPCLKAVSESTLVLASNYAANLQQKGHPKQVEMIKEHCAAATAARQGEFPANAMRSAFVECANTIVDTTDQTGVAPDASHYQLLVGPVLCLDGDRRCAFIEDGLKKY